MSDSEIINKFRINLIKLFKIKDDCYDFYYFKNFKLIDENIENKEELKNKYNEDFKEKMNNYNKEFMEILKTLINNNIKNIDMEDLNFENIEYEKSKSQIIINCKLNFIGTDELFYINKYYKLNITFINENINDKIYIKFNKIKIIYQYENFKNKLEDDDGEDSLSEEENKKEDNNKNNILINETININKEIIINYSDYCKEKRKKKYFNEDENEKNDNIDNNQDSTILFIFKICEKILKKKLNELK